MTGGPSRGVPAFVATTGGHLVQLLHLAQLLEPQRHQDGVWITHRTPQSESMLRGRRVHFVPFIHARRWDQVVAGTPRVQRILRREGVDVAYSTGAAVSLAALPLARLSGVRPVFIESLARNDAPSMAGKILERVPGIERYTQYPQNAGPRWRHEFSLLDLFRSEDTDIPVEPRRVLVTLGTARPWGFRRALERILSILPAGCDVVWQTGDTAVEGLPIDALPLMSDERFQEEIRLADVVVSHSGVGTVLSCLEAGKVPVLVPRRAAHREHVDDHQVQIARVAAARGLALHREVEELTFDDLRAAASRRVVELAPDTSAPRC